MTENKKDLKEIEKSFQENCSSLKENAYGFAIFGAAVEMSAHHYNDPLMWFIGTSCIAFSGICAYDRFKTIKEHKKEKPLTL